MLNLLAGDALDPVLMKYCPTLLEFAELDIMKVGDQVLIDLHRSLICV